MFTLKTYLLNEIKITSPNSSLFLDTVNRRLLDPALLFEASDNIKNHKVLTLLTYGILNHHLRYFMQLYFTYFYAQRHLMFNSLF